MTEKDVNNEKEEAPLKETSKSKEKKKDKKAASQEDVQPFGLWLKAKREKKGISLEEISSTTKIQLKQLEDLEEGWKDGAPASAFVRGFIVSYARILDLDETDVLFRYKSEYGAAKSSWVLGANSKGSSDVSKENPKTIQAPRMTVGYAHKASRVKNDRFYLKKKFIFSALGVLLFIVFLSFLMKIGKRGSEEKLSSVQNTKTIDSEKKSSEVVAETAKENSEENSVTEKTAQLVAASESKTQSKESTQVNAKEEAKKPAASEPLKLVVIALRDSWVNIRVDGKFSRGFQMNKGEEKSYTVKKKVVVSTSDGASLDIRWNGLRYGPLGKQGEVRTWVLPEEISKLKKK